MAEWKQPLNEPPRAIPMDPEKAKGLICGLAIGDAASGSQLGVDGIPPERVKRIEKSVYLDNIAHRLASSLHLE